MLAGGAVLSLGNVPKVLTILAADEIDFGRIQKRVKPRNTRLLTAGTLRSREDHEITYGPRWGGQPALVIRLQHCAGGQSGEPEEKYSLLDLRATRQPTAERLLSSEDEQK